MDATPVRVIDYFNGEKQGIIPLFQRPYTWTKKNWQTLWQDILIQYDAADDPTHFMGAIVSIPAKTVPVGVNKHLIIDGQQRLTTIAVFLVALKDVVDDKTAARIEDYLINRHHDGVDRLKLLPTQADRLVFRSLVLGQPKDESHLMVQAYKFFGTVLRDRDLNDDPIDFGKLFNTVVSSLQVVMINLGESDDPYLIFESLNYKGEPLTQGDLVRNYVLMRFNHSLEPGGEQEAVYLEIWKPLEDSLGIALPEFLRHYGMTEGEDIKTGGIYAALKNRLSGLTAPEVKEKLREMLRYGHFYEIFLNPDRTPSANLRGRLATLLSLNMTTAYPLLLRLFDAHEAERITEGDLLTCLDMIISFSVRRAACNVPSNSYMKIFLQWARNFTSDRVADWLFEQMIAGTSTRRWPSDAEFRTALLTQPQYGKKSTRHLLVALEESHGHKERVDLAAVTIEHVLPQTLTEIWRIELGGDAERIHGELADTLGNLTLTAYNSEMGNLGFAEKKARLATSHIELNRWIYEQPRWTDAEIRARAGLLVTRALEIWPRRRPEAG
jgi:uncharacterized protein with ParB-like and HNH nuclease domain